ncbi:MAG: ribonuclease Z [Oscillospiraceae bacterium]|nr:ribonuclease Z [Oscillospiraceae bacterium]MDY3257714.1 ribonuclease Z [Ruminococcus callidus]
MDLIVCLDDDDGMKFNHRRQSRDQKVINDILNNLEGQKLYSDEESRILFPKNRLDIVYVSDLTDIEGYFFAESTSNIPEEKNIDNLIIYKWNRRYPSDEKFPIPYHEWKMISSVEFVGKSHEKITKEIYKRS